MVLRITSHQHLQDGKKIAPEQWKKSPSQLILVVMKTMFSCDLKQWKAMSAVYKIQGWDSEGSINENTECVIANEA